MDKLITPFFVGFLVGCAFIIWMSIISNNTNREVMKNHGVCIGFIDNGDLRYELLSDGRKEFVDAVGRCES